MHKHPFIVPNILAVSVCDATCERLTTGTLHDNALSDSGAAHTSHQARQALNWAQSARGPHDSNHSGSAADGQCIAHSARCSCAGARGHSQQARLRLALCHSSGDRCCRGLCHRPWKAFLKGMARGVGQMATAQRADSRKIILFWQ